MNEYDIQIDLEHGLVFHKQIDLVQDDYNSTIFNFKFNNKDYSNYTKVFQLEYPNGESWIKEIKEDKITLADLNKENIYVSILTQSGKYYFDVAIYDENSKLTTTKKSYFKVREKINGENIELDDRLPILDDLINSANKNIKETDNLDIDIENGVVTITKKDGTTKNENVKGRGIHYTEIEDNHLIVGYTDGTSENLGEIPGEREFDVDPVFANNTWEKIAEVARYGDPSKYWKLGDYKEIEIDGQTVPVQIIGFNHDRVTNKTSYGKDKAGLTLMLGCTRTRYGNKVGLYTGNMPKLSVSSSDNHIISPNRIDGDGNITETGSNWAESAFRHLLTQQLNSKLPSEIKENIVSVNKIVSYAFNAKNYYRNMVETQDKYFLLSEYEMYGEQLSTKAMEGDQYEFFKLGYSKAVITPELYKAQQSGTTGYTNSRLWLRSVASKYVDPYIKG